MQTYQWKEGESSGDVQFQPGYLGMVWDGTLSLRGPLRPLGRFPWPEYGELADIDGGLRTVTVQFPGGACTIEYEAYSNLAMVLDQLPSVVAVMDHGPPDASPGSGSGYIFFRAKGVTVADVAADVTALLFALNADLAILRQQYPEEHR